jgi:very-short-patch-repair endonuclease
MRRLFTPDEAGLTEATLRWGEQKGRWRRVDRGIWAEGSDEPSELDRARAAVMASGGVASHHLAGVLYGLDSVPLDGTWLTVPPTANGRRARTSRRQVPDQRITNVAGLACTDGLQTLVDLARVLDDRVWEQALESALRKRLLRLPALADVVTGRGVGAVRARRVLGLRGAVAPTESLLETLMVQLARTVPGLPDPVRQLWIEAARARLDLAWPALGLFVELDGQQHKGQPVYDARRETAVVAATGWLCGRFTWTEVVRMPNSTARRLAALASQARSRPLQPRSSSAMPL